MVKGSKPFGPIIISTIIYSDLNYPTTVKDIKLALDNLNIKPNSEIKGYVTVNYPGMYDGVVINTQIIGSNKLIVYKSYNDEKISDNVSRLFH